MDESMDLGKRELEGRFDAVGWGLLFILLGALALPKGPLLCASAAVGGAMLALNGVRIAMGLPIRWFSVLLGSAILVAGGGALASVHMDAFVVFFLLAGVVTIASAVLKPRRSTAA